MYPQGVGQEHPVGAPAEEDLMKSINGVVVALMLLMPSVALGAAQESGTVETKVKTLLIDPATQTPVVVLESIGDKRALPIWIDVPEAKAIALELEHVKLPRPLTHDLIRDILQRLNATLQRVTITELRESTYFALLSLTAKGQQLQIDSRPSDAIALALRMKAPIFVSAQVLARSKAVPAGEAGRAEQTQKKLGVHAQDLTAELAKLFDSQQHKGVIVTDVLLGSAAMKAGLQRGDIITKINDHSISSARELETAVQAAKPAAPVRLEVIKKGKPTQIVIDLPS
jgi:bifunctional DNase/RNase